MKKIRCLSLILSLALLAQCLCPVAYATGDDPLDSSQTGSAVEGSSTDPSGESVPGDETAESQTQDSIPENVTGDASVNSGCNSINAQNPLVNYSELVVEGGAALMYELTTGTLIYAYNPDMKMYPASLTKIMTCLLALEYGGDTSAVVTVSQSALSNLDPSGSTCDLVVGEEMTLENLLYCLMVESANDAAAVISEYVSGSEEAFVALMNQKAKELGCTNTNFANPHGLHDDNHYTSARDLARIMMAALEYDLFREIYSTAKYKVPATNKSDERTMYTTNYMIDTSIVELYYDRRVIGGKTGFTTPAGRCLVAVSESGGMQLLTVFLGGKTAQDESGNTTYGSFEETTQMLNYGFDHFTTGQILSPNEILVSLPVAGGENNTQACVRQSAESVLPIGYTYDQLRFDYVLDEATLTAPVEAGESLGVVRVWYQSRCLAQREIFATVSSQVKQTEPEQKTIAQTIGLESDAVQIVLTVILILLGLILLMVIITMIRNAIIRARRKRRRRNRIRSR